MPIITRKTIHSYSTEDPAFPAKNLLENHKTARWKCKAPGEKSAFIVLKLDKPYHINKLDIGNEWSAFMEILVGNSQQDPPEFKELVLTSSFMTEKEARSEQNPNRIRFFEKSAMVESVAEQQWDLVKIICTQPFNTRKQFGVAFITLYTPDDYQKDDSPPPVSKPSVPVTKTLVVPAREEKTSPSTSKATKKIGKFAFRDSSDEEDDKDDTSPFKKWKMKKDAPKSDFKSQIKSKLEETRKRIRSTSGSSSEGGDKNISRPKKKMENRNRSKGLMYESSDDEPNERLQKKLDKDRESQVGKTSSAVVKPQVKSPTNKFASFISDDNPSTSLSKVAKVKTPIKKEVPKKEPQYKPFNKLMEDVVFVISGYVNPERGTLRQKALDMGARYKGDWDNSCTHLICAFANTPKFNQVKGKGKIVSAKWIESCFSEQKRLPWRRFAVDRDDKQGAVSEEEILCEWHRPKAVNEHQNESDSDGDMLIVDNRKKTPEKKQIIVESDDDMVVVVNPPASPPKITIDDDENETENAPMEVQEAQNDEEQKENVEASYDSESSIDITMVECEAFKGKTFYLNDDLPAATIIKFRHIIKHMLGTIIKDASKANYIVTKHGRGLPKNIRGEVVKDLWIEECHDLQAFIPTTRYKL